MKILSRISWLYLAYCAVWPISLLIVLDAAPSLWVLVVMQVSLVIVLLGGCIEIAASRSPAALLLLLVFAVLAGILTHALYYSQLGLVESGSGLVSRPSWRDALYFSIVTFTTLGYGDLAPREEYRLLSAFQAIHGYVFLGALVGMLVAVFSGTTKLPPR